MFVRRSPAACALALFLLLPAAADAQGAATEDDRPLRIGIADSPPFAIREADGTWTGLSLELWQRISARLDLSWELVELESAEVDDRLADGRVDLALGGVAVTAAGIERHDYTQPYHTTGLGIAQIVRGRDSWRAAVRALADRELLVILGMIALGVLVVGLVITLIERRHAAGDFGGPLSRAVAVGVWWAAVTMTTVGYGDTTPKSGPGRAVALLWMFVGVVVVAIFTATVTTMLTVGSLQGVVQRPGDLFSLRLGATSGSAGAEYLARRHARFRSYPRYEDALAALARGELDAVVADQPSLRFLVTRDYAGEIGVSPIVLEPLTYAIGLPPDSPLRKSLDRAVLDLIEEDSWMDVQIRYLGHP